MMNRFAKSAVTRPRLVALIAALLFVICISKPLAIILQRTFVLRMQTVDETSFREAVSHAPDEGAFLAKAWRCGKIPHREAVVHFLKDNPAVATPLIDEILVAAAHDGDTSVREIALPALAARKNPALPELVGFQLTDADPDLRLLGLNYLSAVPTNRALPLIAFAVNDSNVIVAASAIGALQKLTGNDFGLRVGKVVDEKLSPEPAKDFEAKRNAAQEWLAAHGIVTPQPTATRLAAPAASQAIADFELRDLKGNTVRLSDFRGKTVLLNFWTTWCTACQSEFATLNGLQKNHPDDLLILGISLDANSDAGEVADGNAKHTTVEQRVARTVAARGIQYRVLLDPESSVGARFNGGELPTNVLINKNGCFERRFMGLRALEVFEAMLRKVE
jgi:thiol-disulfide isomerase/thioredoxin